jgi:hypothetical protein
MWSGWGNGTIGVVAVTIGTSALVMVVVLSIVPVACARRTHAIAQLRQIFAHACGRYRRRRVVWGAMG